MSLKLNRSFWGHDARFLELLQDFLLLRYLFFPLSRSIFVCQRALYFVVRKKNLAMNSPLTPKDKEQRG